MRRHRFYVKEKRLEEQCSNGSSFDLPDPDLAHQLLKVFRFRTGDEIILFDGSGFDYVSRISIAGKKISFNITEKIKNEISSEKEVTLFLSIIKKGNFELVTEKVVELGISKIIPFISNRSEKKDLKIERLQKIAIEAAEQSGRDVPPLLSKIISLEDALGGYEGKKFAFHLEGKPFHGDYVPTISHETKIGIFIGPEGGWSEDELSLFKSYETEIYSLGKATLRAETAAIVASAFLML